ncbi:UNKNOWN [Stylonychia lemnae]|uniref:Ankyrin repeat-containing protein n=1 Tax=Stylonychia lemnae TaxID=5949 RepID=A0A078A597_STYLE|nr:UNKNOWN [Stylonychia lemnae]|eukprot:CDW77400.1 UNKNOWN [Stylonychia lemnae]
MGQSALNKLRLNKRAIADNDPQQSSKNHWKNLRAQTNVLPEINYDYYFRSDQSYMRKKQSALKQLQKSLRNHIKDIDLQMISLVESYSPSYFFHRVGASIVGDPFECLALYDEEFINTMLDNLKQILSYDIMRFEISEEKLMWIDEIKLNILKIYDKYFPMDEFMEIQIKQEFTLVHIAISTGSYQCVSYFIDKYSFDVDFYKPHASLTLLHVVAKFIVRPFTKYDKENIRKLVQKSNNLLLRNNFKKTIIELADSVNLQANKKFLFDEISQQMYNKMLGLTFVMDKLMQKRKRVLNKYIIRNIYQYIDG